MAGAGYRTFQSGEILTSNNVQTYLMDQAVQVYAGTAARASAIPSPSTGMVAYATATGLQVFNGSAWVSVGGATWATISGGASTALGTAIGGTTYNVHTFTSDANLVVTTAGLAQVLLIGGGGGAGYGSSSAAGGAGGGGVLDMSDTLTIYLAAGTYAVDVGAGGAGGASSNNKGANGLESAIGSILSVSGGGYSDGSGKNGGDGSSGGGNRHSADGTTKGVTVQASVGNNAGDAGATNNSGGGGGGAGGVGGNGSGTSGGSGGNGIDISGFISGSTYYAGAGGGASGTGAAGAAGNGGVAGKTSGTGNSGVNYGAGGGGSVNAAGGAGAAGAVFVRFKV